MLITEIIYSTFLNKCPRCHKGKVFANNNPYRFKNAFEMKDLCTNCNLKYEREPGFFFGALYVSYALMSGIFIVWFFVNLLWLHLPAIKLTVFVVSTMLFFFPFVYRISRIVWLNFFFRFDKKVSSKK